MPVICEILRANEKLNMMSSIHSGKYTEIQKLTVGYMGRKEDVHFCNSICSTRPMEGQDHSDSSYTIFKNCITSLNRYCILWTEKEKDDSQNNEMGGEVLRLVPKI